MSIKLVGIVMEEGERAPFGLWISEESYDDSQAEEVVQEAEAKVWDSSLGKVIMAEISSECYQDEDEEEGFVVAQLKEYYSVYFYVISAS